MAAIVPVTSPPPPALSKHPLGSHSPVQTILVDAQSYFPNPLEKQSLWLPVIASRLAQPAGEARLEPRRSASSLQHRTLVASGVFFVGSWEASNTGLFRHAQGLGRG